MIKRPPHVLQISIRARVTQLKDVINKRFNITKDRLDEGHVRQEQINRLMLEIVDLMKEKIEQQENINGIPENNRS